MWKQLPVVAWGGYIKLLCGRLLPYRHPHFHKIIYKPACSAVEHFGRTNPPKRAYKWTGWRKKKKLGEDKHRCPWKFFFLPPHTHLRRGKSFSWNNKSKCELKIRGDGKSLSGTVELFLGKPSDVKDGFTCQHFSLFPALMSADGNFFEKGSSSWESQGPADASQLVCVWECVCARERNTGSWKWEKEKRVRQKRQ